MQSLLKTTWFAGLAGLMAMAAACGDDTGGGGAGGGSGGGGTGGEDGTPSSSASGTPTSSSSGQSTTNSTSTGQNTTTSGQGGEGGSTTGQGGEGGGTTGQGGEGGTTGQGGEGGTTGQGGDGGGTTGQGGEGGGTTGQGGEGGGDEGSFTLDSGVIDVDIPDDDEEEGAVIELPSSANGTVATIENITVTLTHTFAGDVTLVLEAPESGDFFSVFLEQPETGADFSTDFPITFDPDSDVGASEIGIDLEPEDVIGADGVTSFFPEPEDFTLLSGAEVNGTWRLYAFDSFGEDVGTITRVIVNGTLE